MSIRVATLNTWALPGPLARHKQERLEAIGAALPNLDLDVVAFQEVWTHASRATLLAATRRSGHTHAWHNPQGMGGSGLLVVSRLPFREARFEAFTARGFADRLQHMDYYGGKGFVRLTIETRDGPVVLLDTHLHANYARPGESDEYIGIRAAQVIQISLALAKLTDPVIAVGDFNIEESERAYRVLRGLTGLTDIAARLDRRQITSMADNPYHRPDHVDRRIDYAFCRGGTRLGLRPVSIRRVLDEQLDFAGEPAAYSDHAGLVAELDLAPTAGAVHAVDAASLETGAALLDEGREISSRRKRHQQTTATGTLAAGLGALACTRKVAHSRRRFLKRSLGFASGLSLAFFLEQASLSEFVIRDELASYDGAQRKLAELRRHR